MLEDWCVEMVMSENKQGEGQYPVGDGRDKGVCRIHSNSSINHPALGTLSFHSPPEPETKGEFTSKDIILQYTSLKTVSNLDDIMYVTAKHHNHASSSATLSAMNLNVDKDEAERIW